MRGRLRLPALLIVIAATAALAVAPASAATPVPSPWLQTNYNAANSRANLAETAIGAGNVASLRRAFTVQATPRPADECPAVTATPLLSEARLYAVVGDVLTAWDAKTGRTLWATQVNEPPATADYEWLVVANGQVFVGSDTCATNDPLGKIFVFSASTGASVGQLRNPVGTALAGLELFGGKYLVAQYACAECGGFDHNVIYRTSNGSIAWRTPDDRAQSNAAIVDSVVGGQTFEIARTPDGSGIELRSYLAYNGAPKWTRSGIVSVLAGDTDGADANNLIALDINGGGVDLNPRTGATRFRLPLITHFSPNIAVDKQRIYAPCSAGNTDICAFSTRDGALLWRTTDPSKSYNMDLTVANGLVYLDSGLVLSASTGAVITTLTDHPVLVGSGRVGAYVGTIYDRDRFTVLSLPTG